MERQAKHSSAVDSLSHVGIIVAHAPVECTVPSERSWRGGYCIRRLGLWILVDHRASLASIVTREACVVDFSNNNVPTLARVGFFVHNGVNGILSAGLSGTYRASSHDIQIRYGLYSVIPTAPSPHSTSSHERCAQIIHTESGSPRMVVVPLVSLLKKFSTASTLTDTNQISDEIAISHTERRRKRLRD